MIRGVVLDMDGVLRIGDRAVSEADNFLQELEKNGIPYMISTNECRYTSEEIRDDLAEMNVNLSSDAKIYTSGMAVRDYLAGVLEQRSTERFCIGVLGERGLFETVNELSCSYPNVRLSKLPCQSENEQLLLVVGTLNKIKMHILERGLKWLEAKPLIVTTCIDTSDPSSKGDYTLCMPNQILYLLKHKNSFGTKSYSLGKPHPIHAAKIREYFSGYGISDKEILFIGDSIHTDIQLAEEQGFQSCLVLTGNTNRDQISNFIVQPRLVCDTLDQVLTFVTSDAPRESCS